MKKFLLGLIIGAMLAFTPAFADWARATSSQALSAILASDGAGSGLDADLLDGASSNAFCKLTGGANCTFTAAPVPASQSVACAAGVLALDPTAQVVYLDANNAACVVTLGEVNAVAKTDIEIIISGTAGIGLVTFPNVAGVLAGPLLCSTTGIALGGSYNLHYDAVNTKYIGTGCLTL